MKSLWLIIHIRVCNHFQTCIKLYKNIITTAQTDPKLIQILNPFFINFLFWTLYLMMWGCWGGGGGACRNLIYAMREKSAILPYIDTKDGFKIWKVVGKWILIICLKFTVQQLVSRVTDKHTPRIYTNVKVQTRLNKH